VWMPITAFVALGLEHSVANMFTLPLGMLSGAEFTGRPIHSPQLGVDARVASRWQGAVHLTFVGACSVAPDAHTRTTRHCFPPAVVCPLPRHACPHACMHVVADALFCNLLPVCVGNAIGATVFVAGLQWYAGGGHNRVGPP